MAGIADVARLAGVSTATVSRALSGNGPVSEETRRRVSEVASSIGYVVSSDASSLASGRTRNVGVVVPHLGRWFFTRVVEGVAQELVRHGYDLTLYNLSGDGDERRRVFDLHLLRNRVDAVIPVALKLTEAEAGRLNAIGKPLVGVGGPMAGFSSVTVDDTAVARLATEHLLALGHRRIAHIAGSREFDTDFHIPTHRRLGYATALRAAGIVPDPRCERTADFTIPGGYDAAKQLLGAPHDRPTAIFADSDEMAMGCILAARDLGLSVPGDVSVIGIDDHELAPFFGLSTVAQYPGRQGELAVQLLLSSIAGEAEPADRCEAAPVDLVVRSSTATPQSP